MATPSWRKEAHRQGISQVLEAAQAPPGAGGCESMEAAGPAMAAHPALGSPQPLFPTWLWALSIPQVILTRSGKVGSPIETAFIPAGAGDVVDLQLPVCELQCLQTWVGLGSWGLTSLLPLATTRVC